MKSCNGRKELHLLLRNDLPDLSQKTIVVWGAGNTAALYQQGLKRFERSHPWFSTLSYCDSAAEKWGTLFFGKPVISPEQLFALAKHQNLYVLICAFRPNAVSEISRQLTEKDIPFCLMDEMILKTESEQILRCYDILEDDGSRETFFSVIMSRLTIKEVQNCVPEEYFSHPVLKQRRLPEVFVDCGAFTGDTFDAFLRFENGVFHQYIAIEADRLNFNRLCERVNNLRKKWSFSPDSVVLCNCAVGEQEGNAYYQHDCANGGTASIVSGLQNENGTAVEMHALDSLIGVPYTYLKADIEGCEYAMLCGAERGIKENQPFLAISIYHNAADLYSIPLLIHEYVPDYHFSILHHSHAAHEGTVLYCYG